MLGLRKIAGSAGRNRKLKAAAGLAALMMLVGCKADLYTKVQEQEANEMVAILSTNGIAAERELNKDGSSKVQVNQDQFARSVELLNAHGYPKQTFTSMGEVFQGGGLIASPTEERARFVYALSEELSKTISSIDGVVSARVHVVLPKNDLLRQDATPSSASVFIRHDAKVELKTLLPQIKMLVSNSIEGLSYEKVSVVFVPIARPDPVAAAPAPVASQSGMMSEFTGGLPWQAALGGGGMLIGIAGAYVVMRRRRPEPPVREAIAAQQALPAQDAAAVPLPSRLAVAPERDRSAA
jgi:type III secretion protein J